MRKKKRKQGSRSRSRGTQKTKARAADTIYHFGDRMFRTLIRYGQWLVLPLLNWIFGTVYTGTETVVFGSNATVTANGTERIVDSRIFVERMTGWASYIVECNNNWSNDMYNRVQE